MAMNKEEQELVDKLQVVLALRWCDDIKEDIPAPEYSSGLVVGYTFNNYTKEVTDSCSTSCSHSVSSISKATSQNGIKMFSTKVKALKAMRYATCLEAAKKLRDIDKLIEAENRTT